MLPNCILHCFKRWVLTVLGALEMSNDDDEVNVSCCYALICKL